MSDAVDTSPTDEERRFHIAAAGHRGDAVTARSGLDDIDPIVRSAALGALARLDALSRSEITNGLHDPSAIVRARAVDVAIPHLDIDLRPLLADPVPSVVEATAFALGERDQDPGPLADLIGVAQQHPDELCRESAVAALGALGQAPGVDEEAIICCLLQACEERAAIRRRAVIGLHQFEDPRAEAAVRSALTDPDRQTRGLAGDLLGEMVD